MAKVTYIPEDQDDKRPVQWMGVEFIPRKATSVENPALIEKAKANPFFEVEEGKKAKATSVENPALIEKAKANPFFEVEEGKKANDQSQ